MHAQRGAATSRAWSLPRGSQRVCHSMGNSKVKQESITASTPVRHATAMSAAQGTLRMPNKAMNVPKGVSE